MNTVNDSTNKSKRQTDMELLADLPLRRIYQKLDMSHWDREDVSTILAVCLDKVKTLAPSDQIYVIESAMDRDSQTLFEEIFRLMDADN